MHPKQLTTHVFKMLELGAVAEQNNRRQETQQRKQAKDNSQMF